MDEQELAFRCARRDSEAQRELYETYGSRILALCRRYASGAAEAEDLMQDAFVKIFRVIGRYRWTGPGSLYSWMARVALNQAFDSARKRRRLGRQLVDVEALEGEIPDEPGSLNKILKILADNGRNVEYMYGFTGRKTNSAYMIIRCTDVAETEKVCEKNGIRMVSQDELEAL